MGELITVNFAKSSDAEEARHLAYEKVSEAVRILKGLGGDNQQVAWLLEDCAERIYSQKSSPAVYR